MTRATGLSLTVSKKLATELFAASTWDAIEAAIGSEEDASLPISR